MRILVLHSEPDELRDWLSQRTAGHQLFWAATPEQVQETLPQADPEVVFSIKHSGFPGPAHRQALEWPSVRWLHVGGSGTDHLGRWDLARQTVTNSVGVLAPFHAERALAGLLALSSGLLRQTQAQAQRSWEPSRFATLRGQTALIVGVGRTGTALASLLKALGMRVLGVRRRHERHPDVDEMHEFSQLAQLWPRAQVVSLNVPGGAAVERLAWQRGGSGGHDRRAGERPPGRGLAGRVRAGAATRRVTAVGHSQRGGERSLRRPGGGLSPPLCPAVLR
jgi:phosphoglycerate dehydrogenase-like enzyme